MAQGIDPVSVVASSIGDISTSISNIWTSRNQLKTKQLELENFQNELEQTKENSRTLQLVELIKLKEAELQKASLKERYNANLRAIVYAMAAGIIGFFLYRFGKKEKLY